MLLRLYQSEALVHKVYEKLLSYNLTNFNESAIKGNCEGTLGRPLAIMVRT